MGRWTDDAKGRLAAAALELYAERGFDAVTVAEIAERAGLTERTFFRHFADKREVLFAGADELERRVVEAVGEAEKGAPASVAALAGLHAAAAMLQDRGELASTRDAIIAGSAELRERELIKLASLSEAIARSLRERGEAEPAAQLAGELAIAVFKVAFARWVGSARSAELATLIDESLAELSRVASAVATRPAPSQSSASPGTRARASSTRSPRSGTPSASSASRC